MNKTLVACAAGLLFVAGSANAISVSGEAGEHYTNLGVGLGGTTAGLGINGNWIRSDHDGDIGSLGLSFGLPVGPLTATVGGKAIYLSPKDGKDGGALALGGGLQWDLNRYLSLYGEGYFAPESLTSGAKAYNEANGGVRLNVRPFNVDVGYRYINIEGKDGNRDNAIADGPYIGVGMGF